MALALFYGVIALVFFGLSAGACYHLRWVRRLPAASELAVDIDAERLARRRCTVVIAARDEAARIERTVVNLLNQVDVAVDVIVVDDRSRDDTPRVLDRLGASDSRVRTIRVDALPAGWLGKCYACHVGATAASGEWILFTDADCWLTPDLIVRALAAARREHADHVTLTPGVTPHSIAAAAWHLLFLVSVANWMSGVNRDRRGAHLGMGAFNLVRAEAYRASGGYERLRLTVLDDVKLGLLLHRAGARTRAYLGTGDVECQWGHTIRHMIAVMEKNYFAAIDYRLSVAIAVGIGGPLLWIVAMLGPITGGPMAWLAACGVLSLSVPAGIVARRLPWTIGPAIAAPFVYPVLCYAVLNSALTTVRQGGVRWRDTFYSLAELRKGGVR